MFTKLIGIKGHTNYVRPSEIRAIQICDAYDEGHEPRIDVVVGDGATLSAAYSEENLMALQLIEIVDKHYAYIPPPEGWAPPAPQKSIIDIFQEEAARARMKMERALELDKEETH